MRFDVRTIQHRIRRHELSQEEVQAHLDTLPDEAEEGEETQVEFTRNFEERHRASAKNAKE